MLPLPERPQPPHQTVPSLQDKDQTEMLLQIRAASCSPNSDRGPNLSTNFVPAAGRNNQQRYRATNAVFKKSCFFQDLTFSRN
jgi:hypothetical protein